MKKVPFKTAPQDYDQRTLFPSNVFDLLRSDHECFVYQDIIEQLDTSDLEQQYSVKGQNAYHPKLILGILIYAYSHGVFSSRQIEIQCNENIAFMYISHMNCPNFRVISDFRKANLDYFKSCFIQIVKIAREAGLASLGHVSLDGSKFKADTSKHKAMSYKRLKEKEAELVKEIEDLISKGKKTDEEEDSEYGDKNGYEICEELKFKETRLAKIKSAREALEKREQDLNPGKKIDDKKQISFADKDSRIMGKKGNYDYRYNGQIIVDSDHQIIVGEHLSKNANDKQEVEAALNEIKETTGVHPEKCSIDNGYFSGANLRALSETEIDVYMATGKGEREPLNDQECNLEAKGKLRKLDKRHFTYHSETDSFTCPVGYSLKLERQNKDGTKTYKGEKSLCAACRYRSICCSSNKGESRSINTDKYEGLRQSMREKMSHEDSKAIYKKRKIIVEPVFGQIKNGGFSGFHLRGYEKASGEFSFVCAVHNVKKMVKAVFKGVVRLEGGKLVPNRI